MYLEESIFLFLDSSSEDYFGHTVLYRTYTVTYYTICTVIVETCNVQRRIRQCQLSGLKPPPTDRGTHPAYGNRHRAFKVSRDFEWQETILMNRLCVPDVPLEVYSFLNLHLHIVFYF